MKAVHWKAYIKVNSNFGFHTGDIYCTTLSEKELRDKHKQVLILDQQTCTETTLEESDKLSSCVRFASVFCF